MKKKKKALLPVPNKCRNCGTQLISRYCHNCSQDLFAGRERTVREIAYNTVETAFAFDNKILRTLKYLLFYPGKLTKEFFAGKVVRYVYPAKLFWFISLIFFATFSIINDKDDAPTNSSIKISSSSKATDKDEKIEYTDTVAHTDTEVTPSSDQTQEEIENFDERKLLKTIQTYIPYIMFVLIPFFALLVQLFFYKKRRYYAHQVIFALHFHSFVFLLFALCNIAREFFPSIEDELTLTMIFVPAIYFAIALYVVYRPSRRGMLWKIPCIMLCYAIGVFAILVLYCLLTFCIIYGFQHIGYLIN